MRYGLCYSLFAVFLLFGLGCQPSSPSTTTDAPGVVDDGPPFELVDITDEAGLSDFRHITGANGNKWFPEAMGAGCAFLDYDGDGLLDILLVGGGEWGGEGEEPALWLFQNQGDGTFRNTTQEAGLANLRAYGFGLAIGDYDNDGDDDIYFSTLGPDHLLQNTDGRFVDVAGLAGLPHDQTWSTTPVFFDADRDGWLDLYVGTYVDWSPEKDIFCTLDGETKSYCTPELYEGAPSRFYRNQGDGTFRDETRERGFYPGPGKMLGAVEFDYNRDDLPDLVVASDTQPDLLYQNQGDGTYKDIGSYSGIAYDENGRARAGMGIDTGVVDETGQVSVFVGNFSKEMIAVYRYQGSDLFIDRAAASKIGRPSLLTLTFGLFLFDPDLDGDLDLFAGNGHVQQEIAETQDGITYAQSPHLFLNEGDGRFADSAPMHGGVLARPIVARGAVYGDIDRDGDLDVLVVENGGGAHLWRNDVKTGHQHFRIALEGVESNRNAFGARVIVKAGDVVAERRVRSGGSFLSQSESVASFGLGPAQQVDTLTVEWPSGARQQFTQLPANRTYHLKEGDEAGPVELNLDA